MARTPRLLVVESDPHAAGLLARIFEVDDYDVAIARNIDFALVLAHSQRPDAILLDLELSHAYGGDLLRTLRTDATLRDVPIVALSNTFDLGLSPESNSVEFGANAVVTKPLGEKSLLLLLDRVHGIAPPPGV